MKEHLRWRWVVVLAAAVAAGPIGCEEEPEPAEQFEQSVEQAAESLGEAQESLERLEQRGETLDERIEERSERIEELMRKQLALLDQQLDRYTRSVAALPAGAETEMRRRVAQLRQEREQVEAVLRAYIQATGERADQLRPQLEARIEQLEEAFDNFERDLAQAREQAL